MKVDALRNMYMKKETARQEDQVGNSATQGSSRFQALLQRFGAPPQE